MDTSVRGGMAARICVAVAWSCLTWIAIGCTKEPRIDDARERAYTGEEGAVDQPPERRPTPIAESPVAASPVAASPVARMPAAPRPAKVASRRVARPARDELLSGESLGGLGTLGAGQARKGVGRGYAGGGLAVAGGPHAAPHAQAFDAEAYAHVAEQGFVQVQDSPLSTFSVDVDTASYSNVRRMLREGRLPPADAVRIEEMINYFRYDYPAPSGSAPVAIHTELAAAPWDTTHRLVKIGLRARDSERGTKAPRNLVFLVDVSGSMQSADKLPLLKRGLGLLARDLTPQDRLSIVVYAGASGLALPPTRGSERNAILSTLERLEAGGSTNGAEGIELAYRVARNQFVTGGINRVILATDGDFNVGATSQGELTRLIEEQRESGVFLTVLGFGTGNLKDSTMETLANKGNGNYAYIDSLDEAHKVLVREAGATLVTVAKDVKLQVEWNPRRVASYRLIGYENRRLADRDFNDDHKDAGEMGAGHTVTALYDVVLRGESAGRSEVDPLRYQADRAPTAVAASAELLTVKLRYKAPDSGTSALLTHPVLDAAVQRDAPLPSELSFAAAVAGFGMLLRGSAHKGTLTLEQARGLALRAVQSSPNEERSELLELMDEARRLGVL